MGDRLEGQRRQVTVLFADMVGYTPLAASLGEERTYFLMQRIIEEASEAIHAHGGTVQALTGDGLMALFGAPIAMEDAPLRACRAALDIQVRMSSIAGELESEFGTRPKLRIGLHSGPVVIGALGDGVRMEITALGDTVNLASRLESAAGPGAILMSKATHDLVDPFTDTVSMGLLAIKGIEGAQQAYQLDSLKHGVSRFEAAARGGLTPFVGRRHELEALIHAWDATREGTFRVVNVVGEAGIGKSRLIHEFRQHLIDQEIEAFVLRGECTTDGRATAFRPFIDVVRGSFRIAEGAGTEETERRLRSGLDDLGMQAAANLPFLLNLLGHGGDDVARLGPEIVGARTRATLQGLLRERCRLSQSVLLIEDLHWIDTASEQLLNAVVDSEKTLPLFVICACRPEYEPPWSGAAGVLEVPLAPLPENGIIDLLKDRLGADDLPAELVQLVVEKSDGNPLFAEEIAGYLAERRSADAVGTQALDKNGSWPALPVNLENLLMDRVDRLEEGPRAILQTASVIGRRFSVDLVETVSNEMTNVKDCLDDLEQQKLILTDVHATTGADYAFKHALVQNAVYNTLLGPERQRLHAQVAQAIETQYPDRLGEFAEILAHHYGKTSYADKAVHYEALAGEKALGVLSLDEADQGFARAFKLIETVPGCADDAFLAGILVHWLEVSFLRSDLNKIIEQAEKYLPLLQAEAETRQLSLVLSWLGIAYLNGERFIEAQRVCQRALRIGEALGDDECIIYATVGLMWTFNLSHAAQPETIVEKLGDRVLPFVERYVLPGTLCLAHLSLDCLGRGYLGSARKWALQLIELGRTTKYQPALGFGLGFLAWNSVLSENYEEAIEYADEALGASQSPLPRFNAMGARGAGLALIGRTEDGLETLAEVRREITSRGFLGLLTGTEVPYGAALVLAGKMSAGTRFLEDTVALFARWEGHRYCAWAHAMLGEIYLQIALGNEKPPLGILLKNLGFVIRTVPVAAKKAGRHLSEAVRIGREAGARGFTASSLLNLGLLAIAKKRPDEARAHLEEAREVAKPLGWPLIEQKIDSAFAELK